MNEVRKTDPWDPESSTLHRAPRALSTGVVDSLGESFVGKAIATHARISSQFVPLLLLSGVNY